MRLLFTLCAIALSFGPVAAQSDKKTDFAHDVVPILKAKCATVSYTHLTLPTKA